MLSLQSPDTSHEQEYFAIISEQVSEFKKTGNEPMYFSSSDGTNVLPYFSFLEKLEIEKGCKKAFFCTEFFRSDQKISMMLLAILSVHQLEVSDTPRKCFVCD
jgi:hypothetical protein